MNANEYELEEGEDRCEECGEVNSLEELDPETGMCDQCRRRLENEDL